MSKSRQIPSTVIGAMQFYLEHCGESLGEVGRQTGIDSGRLSRFVRGERGLRMEHLDTLGKYLKLRVVRAAD